MADKKGKCVNIDCDHYKEVFDVKAGEEMVCPFCKQHLDPVEGNKGKTEHTSTGVNKKLIAIIGGAVVVIAAIIGAVVALSGSKTPDSIDLNTAKITLKEGESKTLEVMNKEDIEGMELKWEAESDDNSNVVEVSQDGKVTALHKGKAKVTVYLVKAEEVSASCDVVVEPKEVETKPDTLEKSAPEPTQVENSPEVKEKPTKDQTTKQQTTTTTTRQPTDPNYGTVKVSYGKYTGYLQNGKPHGHGTVVFTSSYKFAEGISASPGDKYEGAFRNGRISGMGYLYHDGNQTTVRP